MFDEAALVASGAAVAAVASCDDATEATAATKAVLFDVPADAGADFAAAASPFDVTVDVAAVASTHVAVDAAVVAVDRAAKSLDTLGSKMKAPTEPTVRLVSGMALAQLITSVPEETTVPPV